MILYFRFNSIRNQRIRVDENSGKNLKIIFFCKINNIICHVKWVVGFYRQMSGRSTAFSIFHYKLEIKLLTTLKSLKVSVS